MLLTRTYIQALAVEYAGTTMVTVMKTVVAVEDVVVYKCSNDGDNILGGDNQHLCAVTGAMIGQPPICQRKYVYISFI